MNVGCRNKIRHGLVDILYQSTLNHVALERRSIQSMSTSYTYSNNWICYKEVGIDHRYVGKPMHSNWALFFMPRSLSPELLCDLK